MSRASIILILFCKKIGVHIWGELLANLTVDSNPLPAKSKIFFSFFSFSITVLAKIKGVICPKPKGAFYCIAQLPVDNADKFAQWLLEEFDHEGKTLMLAPAAGFYSTPETGTNQVRIAYVLNQEALNQAIICLKKALETYPGRIN